MFPEWNQACIYKKNYIFCLNNKFCLIYYIYLFRLLARLTIVATVRQYSALANESLVIFDMLASQTDFISCPLALWVRVVKPRNNADDGTPRRLATAFNSGSPLTSTSSP